MNNLGGRAEYLPERSPKDTKGEGQNSIQQKLLECSPLQGISDEPPIVPDQKNLKSSEGKKICTLHAKKNGDYRFNRGTKSYGSTTKECTSFWKEARN